MMAVLFLPQPSTIDMFTVAIHYTHYIASYSQATQYQRSWKGVLLLKGTQPQTGVDSFYNMQTMC